MTNTPGVSLEDQNKGPRLQPLDVDAYDPEQHRCGSCRWHDVRGLYEFHAGVAREGMGGLGFCRRRPPQFDPSNEPRTEDSAWGVWPETGEADWCGDWETADLQNPGLRRQLGLDGWPEES